MDRYCGYAKPRDLQRGRDEPGEVSEQHRAEEPHVDLVAETPELPVTSHHHGTFVQ